ncbi:MAG TPA: DUF4126 family protein [Terriglobales bacterium]|jgi:uncharacterized membrane protein|nr:DUF4126 family protein [Terriglobales bacterium]
MHSFVLLAIGIGIVAGLRAMTAPAAVSWAAHLGWLHLQGTPLSFMGSTIAVAILTIAAIGELINDQLPKTPARIVPPQFITRIVMAGLCGACLYLSAGSSWIIGALLGAVGAVIGTLGGYYTRRGLVAALGVKDIVVAIPEDLIAIGLAYFIVR